MTKIEQRLRDKGINIAALDSVDTGKFVQFVQAGDLLFTSGQISMWENDSIKGKVGGDLSVTDGYRAAQFCTYNCLRVIKTATGSLDKVKRVVKLLGMVNVAPGFDDTSGVINGASELLRELFGDAGFHARSAVGMVLPFNWAVEVEMIVQLRR